MNASDFIDVLAAWLREIGVSVDMHAFDLHHGGLYRSETCEVFVNVSNAERALTLAHEAGHHVGYVLAGERNDKRSALHRERQAYVYGWRVLQLIRADKLISRQQWIATCCDDHRRWVTAQKSEAPTSTNCFRA